MKAFNKDGYNYYKVDVALGCSDGYSFMIRSKKDLNDTEVIEAAREHHCFEDDQDTAEVDRFIDDHDVNAFKSCTTTV